MTSVKADERKIREIARKLGVSQRTVEEYLPDRLTLQQTEQAATPADEAVRAAADRARARHGVVDRFGRPLKEHAG